MPTRKSSWRRRTVGATTPGGRRKTAVRRSQGAPWRQGQGGGGVLRLRAVEGRDRGEVKAVAIERTAKRWVVVVSVGVDVDDVVCTLRTGPVSAQYIILSV